MRKFIISFVLMIVLSFSARAEVIITDEPVIYTVEDMDFMPNENIPLTGEQQQFLWDMCKSYTRLYGETFELYTFMLGVMEQESSFKLKATHYNRNKNGEVFQVDRGIIQVGSCWRKTLKKEGIIENSCEELYDYKKCVTAGMFIMMPYIQQLGISEAAYCRYYGYKQKTTCKESRNVWSYKLKWESVLTN